MKKIVLVTLLLFACLLFCVGCAYESGKSFDTAFLETVSLADMPLPESEEVALKSNVQDEETLRFSTDKQGFTAYVKRFVSYMQERTDIYYFGARTTEGLIAEMFPHYVAEKIDDSFDYTADRYIFSYSLTNEFDYDSNCRHAYAYKSMISVKMSYDAEKQRATITIHNNETFKYCLDSELAGFGEHSITYQDHDGALYPDYCPTASADSGDTVTIKVSKIMDADVRVTVTRTMSETLYPVREYDDYYEYTFYMPATDVTVTIDIVPPDVVYLFYREDWLWELNSADISAISVESGALGVAPDSSTEIKTTADREEIIRLHDAWKQVILTQQYDNSWNIDGGSFLQVTFHLSDDVSHSIRITNGFYNSVKNEHYTLSDFPMIAEDKITSTSQGTVWS